jgi:hypothetical protein
MVMFRRSDCLSVEHIDPRKGVLVCGLDNDFNTVIADADYNDSKSNRFVPYRVCEHQAPMTFGDLCEFLIDGEWVVCEFGGEVWWKESNRIGNARTAGRDWCRANYDEWKVLMKNRTYLKDVGRRVGVYANTVFREQNPEAYVENRRRGAYTQHSQRWECLITGYVSTPGPLSRYQKARGIDTSQRRRIQ